MNDQNPDAAREQLVRELERQERENRQLLASQPDNPTAHFNLGVVALRRGQFEQAISHVTRAAEIDPRQPAYFTLLGVAHGALNNPAEGIRCFRKVLELDPGNADAHHGLGEYLMIQGNWTEAATHYRQDIAANPTRIDAHLNLGNVLAMQNEPEQAAASFRQVLAIDPGHADAHSNLLLTCNYLQQQQTDSLYRESVRYDEQHARRLLPPDLSFDNQRDVDKVLKIGYVSPDFRSHSVAHFIIRLLGSHDRNRFEIFCYASVAQPDGVTEILHKQADHWRSIAGIPDDAVAEQIRRDGIDILVDLAGHTSGNRLPVFARKPAPVQVTWLGYPATTGLSAMDYRLTDAIADPPGEADELHTEKLVRLTDGFLCYQTDIEMSQQTSPPCIDRGYVTFGNFNTYTKTSPETLRTWAQVMARLPDARLVLKSRALSDPGTRERCTALFAEHGVAAERLDMLDWVLSRQAHLDTYAGIDIALDPFPYNGTTTTFEALHMGVPVMTLRGNQHAGRVGSSIMQHAGLAELIAESPDEYIDKVVALAQDPQRLAGYRQSLPEQIKGSVLTDVGRFTQSLENAYRDMWQNWCAQS